MRLAILLILALLAAPVAAQESDCFTAVARDSASVGRLVAADTEGPRTIHSERGYDWQAMAVHPETGNLWTWGAGGGASLGELYVYDPSGTELAEYEIPSLRQVVVNEILWLGDGRRMVGRGYQSGVPFRSFVFSLETRAPVESFRIRYVPSHALGLLVIGPRVITLCSYVRGDSDDFGGPATAVVYDRRTRLVTEEPVWIPHLDGAHQEAGGRLWVWRNGSYALSIARVENPTASPSAWTVEDRSADVPIATFASPRAMASSDGVLAVLCGRGVVTFRDGVRVGGTHFDAAYGTIYRPIMVSDGGSAILFGGPLNNSSGEGWIETRSTDLSRLYWRELVEGEPRWMAAD